MSFAQFANSSPEWLVLLILLSCILPMILLPFTALGMFRAKVRNRIRAWMRFLYLFLPWLPFAGLAGLYIMSLSNMLLGSLIALVFVAVRLYFIHARASSNGLQAAMA